MRVRCYMYLENTATRCDLDDRHSGPCIVSRAARDSRKLEVARAALTEIGEMNGSEACSMASLLARLTIQEMKR